MTMFITIFFFFFNDTATTEIYTTEDTLFLHDALPISFCRGSPREHRCIPGRPSMRSEEHTSELQSPSVISYAVFCLKKKKQYNINVLKTHLHKKLKTNRDKTTE